MLNLITQENHYYPFGLNITALKKEGKPDDRWKYNGRNEFNQNFNSIFALKKYYINELSDIWVLLDDSRVAYFSGFCSQKSMFIGLMSS